jgi:hypothetical protein
MSNTVNISSIDSLLVGNPQITYFKSIYRRHTQFMKYVDEIRPNTDNNEYIPLSTANNIPIKYKINQSKYDLISDICIKHKMKFTANKTIYANLGNTLINYISLDVGQTDLYKIEGLAMEILSEAENPFIPSKKGNFLCPPHLDNSNGLLTVNTGNNYNITCFAGGVSGSSITENLETDVFFTRPNFDFCKYYDKSFPLCALVHSDVVFNVNYNPYDNITGDANASLSRSIVIEGISLSSEEKRRIINNTDIYIHNNVISLPTFIGYQIYTPIKSIYITKKNSTGSVSSSINTPGKLTKNDKDFSNFKIDTGALVYSGDPNTIIDILTKYNINKYYGYNGFGGRDLSDGSPSENKGFLASIGLFTQGLENSDQPNGHISSSSKLNITGISNDYKIYIETINFYQIISGHLGKMFVS